MPDNQTNSPKNDATDSPASATRGKRLGEVAILFLRMGLTAFGGPAAHIALIEEECVRRRGWLSREHFLDLLGAANLIPGPTSTELVMHCGLQRAGWLGLFVAGVCFITPTAVIVGLLAAVYVQAGDLPAFEGLLQAVKPVVVIVVFQALFRLTRTAIRTVPTILLAGAAVLITYTGIPEVWILLLAGVVSAIVGRRWVLAMLAAVLSVPMKVVAMTSAATAITSVAVSSLFTYFLKTGAVIFGSGYVLFALLEGDLVQRYGWLTQAQLLDAIAVGQVTPGPVFTSATFIGYLLAGPTGAVVATFGIFLPAFLFTALSATLVRRIRNTPAARGFLDGVNAAAVALIAVVLYELARSALVDLTMVAIAAISAVLILWLKVNSAWVIVGAAAIGLVL